LPNGQIWKIWFTAYAGGAEGKFVFNSQKIRSGADINEVSNSAISMYPNPAKTYVNIANQNSVLINLDVVDIQGKVVYSDQLLPNSTNRLNTEVYNSGIYTLRFQSEKGLDYKKLIIE
jgi:hypothetical protein